MNALMSSDGVRDTRLVKFAVEEHPACGTPLEALAYHKLDGKILADRVLDAIG